MAPVPATAAATLVDNIVSTECAIIIIIICCCCCCRCCSQSSSNSSSSSFNLIRYVHKSTHSQCHILDLVITCEGDDLVSGVSLPSTLSDHFLINT